MNTFNPTAGDSIFSLTVALDRYGEAGIDPAFDAEWRSWNGSSPNSALTQAGE